MPKVNECELCGHKGENVEWTVTTYGHGFYCTDGVACLERYKEMRGKDADRRQSSVHNL